MVPRPPTDGFRVALTLPRTTISASRWAVHWVLLGLTFVTTTIVGAVLALAFDANRPIDLDQYVSVFAVIGTRPLVLLQGLSFSVTLLSILLAHELGHYLACLYYGIDASLPYFLPFPSPIGTLGAFIRIRSPIYTRRALFDVGIAGPLAGWHYRRNLTVGRQKYVEILQGAVADNPYMTILLLQDTDAGIGVSRLLCSKNPISVAGREADR